MKIESDFYYPFAACTPTDYLRRFFRSLGDFLEDYVALPIERVACRGSDVRVTWRKRTASFFAGAVVATITALWFKASIPMLVAFLPLILLIAAERAVHCGGGGSSLVRRNLATRTVGRIVTLVLVSLFWTQLKLRSVGQLLDYFSTLTVLGSYQSYMVYMTVFNQEYIWALLAAAWLVIPSVLGWYGVDLSRGRAGAVVRTVYCVGLLACFVFSVFVIMPQYPGYAVSPFKYITF